MDTVYFSWRKWIENSTKKNPANEASFLGIIRDGQLSEFNWTYPTHKPRGFFCFLFPFHTNQQKNKKPAKKPPKNPPKNHQKIHQKTHQKISSEKPLKIPPKKPTNKPTKKPKVIREKVLPVSPWSQPHIFTSQTKWGGGGVRKMVKRWTIFTAFLMIMTSSRRSWEEKNKSTQRH